MIDLSSRPRLLGALRWAYRVKAILRWRDGDAKHMDRQRAGFYHWAWRDAAEGLGGRVEDLGHDVNEIVIGDVRTRTWCNFTAIDDPVTLMVAGSKPATYRLLAREGLPVPRHAEYSLSRMRPALDLLERVGGPCVVKPARDTGGGTGVTTGVANRRQLSWVSAFAAAYCRDLLIEEEVAADCYRLLYLDGKLLDAIVHRPPALLGDGRSTIACCCVGRTPGASPRVTPGVSFCCTTTRTCAARLPGGGCPCGRCLRPAPASSSKPWSTRTSPKKTKPSPSNCATRWWKPRRAAQAVGVRLAGVDVMTRDPSRPCATRAG